MSDKHGMTVLMVLISAVILCSLTACSTTGAGVYVGGSPEPADVYVSDSAGPGGGPPPHAPAHGFRRKRTYYYYPDAEVYFDIGRRLYFYVQGDQWRVSASLPSDLRVQLGDHVTVQIDSDTPYLYSGTHKKKYPPGQMKKWK